MNTVNIIGRTTKNPVVTKIGETTKAIFQLAVDKDLSKAKREEMLENGKAVVNFPSFEAWGKTAELIAEYVPQGKMLGITGSLITSEYDDKNGNYVFKTVVLVEKVKFL